MGTTDERLQRIMAELGEATMAYADVMGGPAVEDGPEVAQLEKAIMDAGMAAMPVAFAYLYTAMHGSTELDGKVRRIVEACRVLNELGRNHQRHIAELEKRVEYLESATVRNYTGADGVDGTPAAFKIPDWDASFTADQQARVALTLLLGELHNRFRATT